MIALDPITLFDMGFGPRLVPVTVLGGKISGAGSLSEKVMGKAPGRLTPSGWVGVNVNDEKQRCHDYATAKLWKEGWGANAGFVVGDGYVVLDNDQGKEFSDVIRQTLFGIGVTVLRRFVFAPKHDRDAFFLRVLDFVGDGARVLNHDLTFRKGVQEGKLQLLAQSKQSVVSGTHRDTQGPYVWEHKVDSLEDIPALSEARFYEFWKEFADRLLELGWALAKGSLPGQVAVSPTPGTPAPATIAPSSAPLTVGKSPLTPTEDVVAEAKALLDLLPNRKLDDLDPAKTPLDFHLDDYGNWRDVAYMLAANLGPVAAGSPEAEAIWCDWSNTRPQPKQDPRNLWRSVIAQPDLRFSSIRLIQLAQEFGVLPRAVFPEIDPKDLGPSTTPVWDDLRERWAFFVPTGGFLDLVTGMIVPRHAFADDHRPLSAALAAELGQSKKKGRPVSDVATLFTSQPSRKRVTAVTYAPGEPKLLGTVFNRWNPTEIRPAPVTEAQVKPWLDHVEFIMGSAAERDRFVKWCAFVAQFPKLKPNWHYLVMSVQGVGKDTMVAPVKAAVGVHNAKEEGIYQLDDNFNDAFETKLLVIGETSQPKRDSYEVANRLKHATARPPEVIWINSKFKLRYSIPNRIAVILFSNDLNPLQLERNQRRIHVVNRRSLKPEPPAYYQQLWDWLGDQGGIELTAAYLLSLPLADADVKDFAGGVAPTSDAKDQLEQMNVHPALDVLEGLIEDGKNNIGPFTSLLAEVSQIVDQIEIRHGRKPPPQMVRAWLLDMEDSGRGARRLRRETVGNGCGAIAAKGVSARLWALTDKPPNGREWSDFSDAEILAMWQGKPMPRKAKVLQFPPPPEEELI
jgi:hypothetical protein